MNESSSGGITKGKIVESGDNLTIQMFGKCLPIDCDWGVVSTLISDADDCELTIVWEFGHATKTQTIEALSDGRLKVYTKTHFTDDSGRKDYVTTNYFKRQKIIIIPKL